MKNKETIAKAIVDMKKMVAAFEAKYNGKFAEEPHVGYDNSKTHAANECTLPIITCDPSCLEKCAGTCYVLSICTIPRPACLACEAKNTVLRRIDPNAYYEFFFKEAEKKHLPLRLSDGGDFEDEVQVKAALEASRHHPEVQVIAYTKRLNLLPLFVDRPKSFHIRYSSWTGDELGEAKAREMGFDVTHVVTDGNNNCPYQISKARFMKRSQELAREYRKLGMDTKTAKKLADKQAEVEIKVWHCRDCAAHGVGCCAAGDIRFNVVG